jgi:Ala-tRNA(Pro) deacylase
VDESVHTRLLRFLDQARVAYRTVEHPPAGRSVDAAAARGESLEIGGKALVVKIDDVFALCVLRAHQRLDSGALRRALKASRTRFASRAELLELTGLEPGTVPPFGPPVLGLPLLLDRGVLDNERIAFNAGSLEHSIVMDVADYVRCARPRLVDLARDPVPGDAPTTPETGARRD